MTAVERAVADAHRREPAAVLAATVRVARDLDVAEECVQDAYVRAFDSWARTGIPAKPGAWLTVAARRNAVDRLRRARTFHGKMHVLVEPDVTEDSLPIDPVIDDDRPRLISMCRHPARAREAQVALTPRFVRGISTGDVANAVLTSEATMAARITRARKKIAGAHIPFRIPAEAVLTVVHPLFTTGHTAPSGQTLTRDDLAGRAVDPPRLLSDRMPAEREIRGLLALLVLNHARRFTRTGADGRLLVLEDQDRSAEDRATIAEGNRMVAEAWRFGKPGRFTPQAAFAAAHATAPSFEKTDLDSIVATYDRLLEVWPSPVVALNRATALSMARGPCSALVEVERLRGDERLARYHYPPAIVADLLRRLDRHDEAPVAYRRTLDLADNEAERAFLTGRLAASVDR